jgi:hypothetical protein
MRKLVNATFISLNGVIGSPHKWAEEFDAASAAELRGAIAVNSMCLEWVKTHLVDRMPIANVGQKRRLGRLTRARCTAGSHRRPFCRRIVRENWLAILAADRAFPAAVR